MDYGLKNKRALVTGAGRGIGRDIAIELHKQGAEVVGVSKTPQNLEKLKQEFPGIQTAVLDVSNWAQTQSVVKSLLPLDLLVNNAAVLQMQPMGEITETDYDSIINTNVKSVLNISQIFAEDLKRRKMPGTIVNISSLGAIHPVANAAAYCASKAAVDQITRNMAAKFGFQQIRVNSINPGLVLTDMGNAAIGGNDAVRQAYASYVPLGRVCYTEDIVNAVMFLLSDKSSMITGCSLPIDGGYSTFIKAGTT